MNRYISLLLDYLALVQLHTKKSKGPQFYKGLNEYPSLEELNSFYPEPEIPDIKFEVSEIHNNHNKGRYSYSSQIKTEYECNNTSMGMYYENRLHPKSVNVIVVHGWRLEKMDWIENLIEERLLKEGYNVYYYTLPYHFQRAPDSSLFSGEYMIGTNINRSLQSIKQAVTDIRMLIRWLQSNHRGKVALIGVSFGGMISNMAGVLESGIDCLIPVFCPNCMAYSVWKSIPGIFAKREFKKNNISFEQLKRFWDITDPSNFKPAVPKENILLMNGLFDRFVLMEDSNTLWEAWGKPERIIYPCGHTGIVIDKDIIGKDIVTFLKDRFKSGGVK